MYLRIENDTFGFVTPDIHEIFETDIPITDESYKKFLELQAKGKHFKVKNIASTTFEEIFEEYIPDPVNPVPQEPSELDKLKAENESMKQSIAELTVLVTSMMGGGV